MIFILFYFFLEEKYLPLQHLMTSHMLEGLSMHSSSYYLFIFLICTGAYGSYYSFLMMMIISFAVICLTGALQKSITAKSKAEG